MHKGILFGGAAVVAGAVALGGWQYAQNRVRADIEQVFASLRAAGIDARYATAEVELLSRAVRVGGITLKNAIVAGAEIKIGTASATGVDIASGARASKRVELSNVESVFPLTAAKGSSYRYDAPAIVLNELTLPDLSAARAPGRPEERLAQFFSGLRVSSIVAPGIAASTEITVPPARGGPPIRSKVDITYSGFRIDGLADGRIASWGVDSGMMKAGAGSPFTEATIGSMRSIGVDLMPFLNAGLGARRPVDGLYEVQSGFEMGEIKFRLVDGSSLTLGGMTGGSMSIDPEHISYAKIAALLETIEGATSQVPTPVQTARMAEAVAQLYEGMSWSKVELKPIELQPAPNSPVPVDFKLGSMLLGKFERGKLGEFRISDIAGSYPDARGGKQKFALATLSLKDFDLPKLMRLSSAQQRNPQPTPAQMMKMFGILSGIEIAGLDAVDPTTRNPIKIDRWLAEWSNPVNDIPTKSRLVYRGETAINPRDSNVAPLYQMGFRSLTVDLDVGTSYDEASRTIDVGPMVLKMDRLGEVTLKGAIGNVGRQAFSVQPGAFLTAMQDFTLGAYEAKVTDSGAVALLQSFAALQAPPGAPAPDLATKLRELKADPAFPAGNLATLVDAAVQFLQTPRQVLTIRASPVRGVPLALLLAPGFDRTAVAGVLDRFTVEASLSPAPPR